MLVIRLLRIGRKHQPSYKIVVTDSRRAPKGGRFVAEVGSWNPLTKQRILKKEEIKTWLSKGAKPSDTVYNMLLQEKIIEGKKVDVHKKSKKTQPSPEASAGKEEKPKEVDKTT
jgi:small subunit ribosomal protein S16